MSVEPAVLCERLQVVRGGRKALDDLSATVRAGAVTGLLGPSGSGKSTLIGSIVGVQVIESGSVRVFGLEAGSPLLRSRIGYMTQAPSVYVDLTVQENLRYFARVLDQPPERVGEVIEAVGLEASETASSTGCPAVSARASRLRRRSSAGRSCSCSTSRPWASTRCFAATSGRCSVLSQPTATTLLVSSHVMDEADHCDELVLIREGRLLAAGTPDDLRRRTGADDLGESFLRLIEEERP